MRSSSDVRTWLSSNRSDVAVGTGLLVVAWWAAFWRIDVATVLVDEPVYSRAGEFWIQGDFERNAEHPPLGKFAFGLAQQVFGNGIDTSRLVSGFAFVLTTVVVWRLGIELFSRSAGIVAAIAWIALPKSVGSNEVGTNGDRLERFAMLEPLVTLWMAVALWFGWRLTRHDARTRDAVGLGVAVGLAAATKLIGPVVAVSIAGFLLLTVGWHLLRPLMIAGVTSMVTFGITYLPLGTDAVQVLRDMVSINRQHAEAGHQVFVNGETTRFPPWYTELWYHYDAEGLLATLALVAAFVVMWRRPQYRHAALYVTAFVAVVYLVLSVSTVELRHYRYVAWPGFALVIGAAVSTIDRERVRHTVGVAVIAAVFAVIGVSSMVDLARIEPTDYAALERELTDRGYDRGDEQLVGVFGPMGTVQQYLRGWQLRNGATPVDASVHQIVLVDVTYTVRFPDPEILEPIEVVELGRLDAYLLAPPG
ncbi:MAG: glycosyltransferase family 39 protein [Actinomycetota bacterium]